MRSETFYDDYQHRCDCEPNEFGQLVDTPLRAMSYYDYGAHVRALPGGPADLGHQGRPSLLRGTRRQGHCCIQQHGATAAGQDHARRGEDDQRAVAASGQA